ncbi:DUF4145 domain-containing protein [Paraburkholderia phytofirmans]|uniref:DUF4145 domain-containing protein n=1 Tax=Paraburkholderia phytofirmans TaxID=261302 RepID=A0ABW9BTL7_9BURK
MMNDTFGRRFSELKDMFLNMPYRAYEHVEGRYVPNGFWRQWATSAQNLIQAVFGEASPHYRNFSVLYANTGESEESVSALHAVFAAAKDDFEGGYVFNVELRVSGEVFGDFVVLARQSLAEGHKDVAAVLASAALEDALKRYAAANDLDVNQKTMQDVVNALKSNGLVSGAQKTLLDAMPRLRNHAMHAEWGKISDPDVNSVIGFVEQFLLTKFSG